MNELSLQSPADNVQVAKQRMSELISTVQTATRLGVKRVLRTHDDLGNILLAPDYPIVRWRNDNTVDRDTRRFFSTLINKTPFLTDIINDQVIDESNRSQFFYQHQEAVGLGAAYLLEALAVSINSAQIWDDTCLQLDILELDNQGECLEKRYEIIHASRREHVQGHTSWIEQRLHENALISVHNGTDLWKHRKEFFPHLQFCAATETQFQEILAGNLMLRSVIKKLLELEHFCKDWHTGPFDHRQIVGEVSPESLVTLQKYGQERTFLCPDGETRTFNWHIKLTPGAWRIYFYPLEDCRQLIIGYVGRHLSTIKYPT